MGNRAWRPLATALVLLMPALHAAAQTQPWSVTPSIGLRGTYTDNASLAAAPERGEFVTQVSPAIAVSGSGARFRANLNYTADVLFYARNSDENRLANTLNATGNLEAIENFFYIDASSSISQQYLSPFGDRPSDIFTLTDNRTENRSFTLSPYVRGALPGGISYEIRNRNTWSSTDTSALSDVHSRAWSASASTPIRVFGLGVDAADTRTSYEGTVTRPDLETRFVRGRLFWQPDVTLLFSASIGREENNYLLQEQSNDTYGLGVRWRPTPRTTAEANWEHRFFGTARLARLEHRTRLTAWSIAYTRDVTTAEQEFLRLPPGNTVLLLNQIFLPRIPDPLERLRAIIDFLTVTGTPVFLGSSLAFYTEQAILQERLEASAAILGVRNSITFAVFASRSDSVSRSLTTPLPQDLFFAGATQVDQYGFSVNANHRLTGNTSLGAAASRVYAERDAPAALESHTDTLSLNLSHALSPRTSTFAGASYTTSEAAGAPASHARSVFAGLNHRF